MMREAQTPEDFHLSKFQEIVYGRPDEEKILASFLICKQYYLYLVAKIWSNGIKGEYYNTLQYVHEFIDKTINEHLSHFPIGQDHFCFYFSLKLENLASDIAHASQDELPYGWEEREALIQAIYAGVRKLQRLAMEA